MADRTVTYRLAADITQFRAQMAQGAASVRQFGDDLTHMTAEQSAAISDVGAAAGKVGLLAAGGLGAAVMAAANFDESMSKVQAATGETAKNMELLRAAALKAGADTAFSASDAAEGIEALAKAGVSTTDILGGGLTGALDLAAAGSVEVGFAAESAATAMTQFGLAGSDVPHIADLLAAAAGKAQGEVSDFAGALNQSGLVAAQMGLSIEETTGSLAAFASAGLLGSDAGTSLKTMLLRLANPSKEAASAMDRFGISAYDAQGNMRPLSAIAEQLKTGFEGQTQATRDAALATIFGSDAIRAANVLYNQGADGIKDWTKAVDDQGFAADTAATKLNNLKGDWEAFTGSVETALISIGEGKQGAFRGLVQGATEAVNAFNKMPAALQGLTGSLLGVVAITGGAAFFGAKVITNIAATRVALAELPPAAARSAAALRGMGTALAGLLVMDVVSDGINNMFESMDRAAPSVDRLTRNLENLGKDKSKWTALAIRGIGEEVGNLGTLLDDTDSKFAGTLKQTTNWLDKIPLVGGEAANQIENLDSVTTRSLTSWREADATVTALDQSLMQLAGTAGPRGAEKAFNQLAAAQGLSADQQAKLLKLLPEFGNLMRDTGRAGADAGDGTSFFGEAAHRVLGVVGGVAKATGTASDGIKGVGQAAGPSAERLKALEKALADSRKEAQGVAEEFFNLGEKLDNAKVSLSEWLRSLEKQADALRNFRLNAEQAAKRGLNEGLIKSLEAAGTAGALRMRQLANATDAEIGRANKAWREGQREVEKYIDATVHVPKALATDLTVNGVPEAHRDLDGVKKSMAATDALKAVPVVGVAGVATAIAQVASLASRIAALHDRTIYINTVGTTSSFGGRSTDGSADGGTVPKTNLPYADRHPYMLADGEEVISNRYGQADRNRALLKAINAGRLADGGTAGITTYARTRGPGHYTSTRELDDAAQALAEFNRVLSGATRSTETWDTKIQMQRHLLDDEQKELRLLNKAYEDHRAAVQAEVADLQELRQERQALKQSVASNFNGDQWYQSTPENGMSAWQALALSLTNQTASAKAFQDELRAAQGHGLSGGLFQFIAQSGDSALATEFAGMTRQQIRDAEKLFQQRNQAAAAVGSFAGDTIYGHDIREQTHELKGLRADSKAMRDAIHRQEQIIKRQEKTISRLEKTGPERTGDAVGKRINSAAANGRRRRNP